MYGRTFKTLRISLIESCNFACTYCVSDDIKEVKTRKDKWSEYDLVNTIHRLHDLLEFDTIRLTGGEPTLYKGLVKLVKELSILNIPIKLTTNGFLLPSLAALLAKAGLKSINVSLDAVEEDIFFNVTRRKMLKQVLNGIESAVSEGIDVKINSVIMKDVNDSQIIPLFNFSKERNISIRYLELMKMGHLFSSDHSKYFCSQESILNKIKESYFLSDIGRSQSSTTNYWKTSDGYKFGIIANESAPFCNDCDRLRLDSKGNIYGCLSNNKSISVKECNDDQKLKDVLKSALSHKQAVRFTGSEISMIGIGG